VDVDALVGTWRRLLTVPGAPWALYTHGTCVVVTGADRPPDSAAARAVAVLRAAGPVRVGSPSADFGVIDVAQGWVVTCHHPDILTFVAEGDVADPGPLTVGLLGRTRRDQDAEELRVVHVEATR